MARKNVVLIYADDLVWDFLDGMPYLSSEPHGNWVKFPNSIITCPLCGPSRTTLMTGQFATTHGNGNNEVGETMINAGVDDWRMMAPALQGVGVNTAFLGKYINGYGAPWVDLGASNTYRPAGWDRWFPVKASSYSTFSIVDGDTDTHDVYDNNGYLIDIEAQRAVGLVETLREPFTLVWASKAPHVDSDGNFPPASRHAADPVTLTRRDNFDEADVSDKPTWLQTNHSDRLTPQEISDYDDWHKDAIRIMTALDEGIESVVDALNTRGILGNTVIMFCGDNSNLFGEHRHFSKGVPYEEAIGMHLRVRWPGVTAREDDALVSNVDLVPTMLDIGGAKMRTAPDGMSFAGRVQDASVGWRDAVLITRDSEDPIQFSGVPSYRGLRTATHKYVEYRDGSGDVELYDLDSDPAELTNLAGTGLAVETQLAAKLAAMEAALPTE